MALSAGPDTAPRGTPSWDAWCTSPPAPVSALCGSRSAALGGTRGAAPALAPGWALRGTPRGGTCGIAGGDDGTHRTYRYENTVLKYLLLNIDHILKYVLAHCNTIFVEICNVSCYNYFLLDFLKDFAKKISFSIQF